MPRSEVATRLVAVLGAAATDAEVDRVLVLCLRGQLAEALALAVQCELRAALHAL